MPNILSKIIAKSEVQSGICEGALGQESKTVWKVYMANNTVELISAHGFWTFSQIYNLFRIASEVDCSSFQPLSGNVIRFRMYERKHMDELLLKYNVLFNQNKSSEIIPLSILENAFTIPPKLQVPTVETCSNDEIAFQKWKFLNTVPTSHYGFCSLKLSFGSDWISTARLLTVISTLSWFASDHLEFSSSTLIVKMIREEDLFSVFLRLINCCPEFIYPKNNRTCLV